MISEFQAINQTTIEDADGDTSDWIEIRNRSRELGDQNSQTKLVKSTTLAKSLAELVD